VESPDQWQTEPPQAQLLDGRVASLANALRSRRGDRSTRDVETRILTRRIQIAAEDSRLYTRTDRSDEAGSGNLSELPVDVSEKRGTVSPFQQFSFSSII
jgi:hypothetical protein